MLRDTFPLAHRLVAGGLEQVQADVLGREVDGRRTGRLKDAHSAGRLGHDFAAKMTRSRRCVGSMRGGRG